MGGAAFAYNVATLLSFFAAFAGMFRLARQFSKSILLATAAALLFTFWGFRWIRINGHLNVLLSSTLLPWLLLCLERGLKARRRPHLVCFDRCDLGIGDLLLLLSCVDRRES